MLDVMQRSCDSIFPIWPGWKSNPNLLFEKQTLHLREHWSVKVRARMRVASYGVGVRFRIKIGRVKTSRVKLIAKKSRNRNDVLMTYLWRHYVQWLCRPFEWKERVSHQLICPLEHPGTSTHICRLASAVGPTRRRRECNEALKWEWICYSKKCSDHIQLGI